MSAEPDRTAFQAGAEGTSPAASAGDVSVPGATTLPPERARLWDVSRELWAPRTVRAQGPWGESAALTAGRAHTAYRKIVDVVAADADGFRAAVAAAVADRGFVDATHPEPIVIRFEEHPVTAPLDEARRQALIDLGFSPDPPPMPSVPSTRPEASEHTRGWSRWVGDAPTRAVPYYGQTTDVTCGAVAAIMLLEAAGLGRFGADAEQNHAHEIALWRRATNLPACEPVGLAVAADAEGARLATGTPQVILSAPDLVLLEWFADSPDELKLRTQLQRDSLRQAEKLGIVIDRRWISAEEIRDLVASGNDVFLLIALEPLIGDPAPHWVLAHDVIGDVLIVSDPWVEAEHGESWVDTSALPIPLAGIDLITRWGDPGYRGVIVVPR